MTPEAKFKDLFSKNIHRDGSDKLLEHISNSDFFTAPASTRFHDSCEGGLVTHSLRVYDELIKGYPSDTMSDQTLETLTICSLLHDVCKIGFYTTEMRNKKDENGKWIQVPFYTINDLFPYGHGEKSVYLIERFMKLSTEEAVAIRFHMGAYEGQNIWNTLSTAFEKYPLSVYLHQADMRATYLK